MTVEGTILQAAGYFPGMTNLLLSMVPKKMMEDHEKHIVMTNLKLKKRMELGYERPDLIEGLLKKKDEWVGDLFTRVTRG